MFNFDLFKLSEKILEGQNFVCTGFLADWRTYARAQKKMFLALNHKSIAFMFIDIFVWRLDLLTFSTLNFYKLCSQMCEVKKIHRCCKGYFLLGSTVPQ